MALCSKLEDFLHGSERSNNSPPSVPNSSAKDKELHYERARQLWSDDVNEDSNSTVERVELQDADKTHEGRSESPLSVTSNNADAVYEMVVEEEHEADR